MVRIRLTESGYKILFLRITYSRQVAIMASLLSMPSLKLEAVALEESNIWTNRYTKRDLLQLPRLVVFYALVEI